MKPRWNLRLSIYWSKSVGCSAIKSQFSDDTNFALSASNSGNYVWRSTDENCNVCCNHKIDVLETWYQVTDIRASRVGLKQLMLSLLESGRLKILVNLPIFFISFLFPPPSHILTTDHIYSFWPINKHGSASGLAMLLHTSAAFAIHFYQLD